MKKPGLFWLGSFANILMFPLLFYNIILALIVGYIGFLIAEKSGCTFADFKWFNSLKGGFDCTDS